MSGIKDSFKKLSKSEKRVAIAKDVIKQLKKGRFIANTGDYIKLYDNNSDLIDRDLDVKKHFKKIKECQVCALGSALLSCTKFTNKLSFVDVESGEDTFRFKRLSKIFSREELVKIEYAFEGFLGKDMGMGMALTWEISLTKSEIKKTRRFYQQYPYSDERLIAIMTNIVENEGNFII